MEKKRKIARGIVRCRIWLMIALLVLAGWSVTMIGRTNINYDLTRYLSEKTMTRRALKVMEAEFGSAEQLRLMFSGLSDEDLSSVLDTLNSRSRTEAYLLDLKLRKRQAEEEKEELERKIGKLIPLRWATAPAALVFITALPKWTDAT